MTNNALNPALYLSRLCLKNNINSTEQLIKKLGDSSFRNSTLGNELKQLLDQCINYNTFIGEKIYEID